MIDLDPIGRPAGMIYFIDGYLLSACFPALESTEMIVEITERWPTQFRWQTLAKTKKNTEIALVFEIQWGRWMDARFRLDA